MTNLVKYNAARTALAEAHAIDEVKGIRDKAEAMAAYARQAKDTEMIQWVTEIKVRAERRAGQMLAEMPKAIGMRVSGGTTGGPTMLPPVKDWKTLSDLGITKNESSRWQKLARVPEGQFEHAVAAAKEIAGEVTTAAMLRAAKAIAPAESIPVKNPPKLEIVSDELSNLRAENERLKEWGDENAKTAKELLEENSSMAAVFDEDERLSASMAEAKKLREMNRILEERIRGLMNEKNEAIRAAKSWQRKYEQAMRAA